MTKKIIVGVYKITNTETNEFYIGCSTNIERRWSCHKTRYKEPTNREYGKPLYVAMRKYGLDAFKFEVLEEVSDLDELFQRERFYIKSLHACEKGYNLENKGENHGRARLSAADVVDIRERYANLESKRSVYLDYSYKISKTGFHKVWNGYTWPDIKMDVYTEENKRYHKFDTGSPNETNGRTSLTNEDVREIRKRKENGEKVRDVYQQYTDKLTFGSFQNIWYGCNWKDIA